MIFSQSTCLASNTWVFSSVGFRQSDMWQTKVLEFSQYLHFVWVAEKFHKMASGYALILQLLWLIIICAIVAAGKECFHCSKALCWDTFSSSNQVYLSAVSFHFRQLSTEQAVLQESLQKESKVNKRLSMENEELLWKLNNGDLSSPRKVSPSTSLTLQSPRNSGIFSSPPVSPR